VEAEEGTAENASKTAAWDAMALSRSNEARTRSTSAAVRMVNDLEADMMVKWRDA
jgi:hypothetical protein